MCHDKCDKYYIMLQPNFTVVLAGHTTLAELLFTTWWRQNSIVMAKGDVVWCILQTKMAKAD